MLLLEDAEIDGEKAPVLQRRRRKTSPPITLDSVAERDTHRREEQTEIIRTLVLRGNYGCRRLELGGNAFCQNILLLLKKSHDHDFSNTVEINLYCHILTSDSRITKVLWCR
jgi:hypothetical protein